MDIALILRLTKARLGISTNIRDEYLTAIIQGVISDLQQNMGIPLSFTNSEHQMFVTDYAAWRYQSRDKDTGLPRHLQFRMHNLFVKSGGDS